MNDTAPAAGQRTAGPLLLLLGFLLAVLAPASSVKSRTSFGGTAPENVAAAVRAARERFL